MGFAVGQPVPWTVAPDWSEPVRETLAWRTEVLRAQATAVTQHRGLRATPARGFSALFTAEGMEWRLAEQLLRACGGREMLLPIWPDGQQLQSALAAGSDTIACATAGRDFSAGGRALLITGVNTWEIVDVDDVGPTAIELDGVTLSAWPAGTRLYPLRRARVADGQSERVLNDRLGQRTLRFDLAEPCDWPAAWPAATTYLGHPVLTWRPNAGDDDSAAYDLGVVQVNNDIGDPFVADLAGASLGGVTREWLLSGAAEHAAMRALLYALRGAAVPLWLPSFKSDFVPVATIGAAATTISVEWSGYTALSALQPGRRDVRIELVNGTAFHRRITAAAEPGGGTETLTIAGALGTSVAPENVRSIELMSLAVGPDAVEFEHLTDVDGVARATLNFRRVVSDV
ncbi:MAG: hypothetical protein IAE86_06505 [Burkholderiaceae bacterium]|nr:hypothetical protein [Burkholderiaceae bacterium]